jgi:hypothetical protein
MKLEKFDIFYIAGLIISTLYMVWDILFGVLAFNIAFLIFFWVINFLAGFGLVLNIAIGFLILFNIIKDKISKRGTYFLIAAQITTSILFIIYAIYRLFSSYSGRGGLSMIGIWEDTYVWIDNIIFIYGIASLIINLYIIPVIKDRFESAVNQGRLLRWKKGAKGVGRGIKKKYFSIRSKHAKAQLQDQMTGKEVLNLWQNKFAVYLLIPTAIAAFMFTPITFILAIYWLKIFILEDTEIKPYENIALLASMIFIGLVAILSRFINVEFYKEILDLIWTVNIFYLIGIILASLIFIKAII